jgi:hypothetical protein
MVDKLFTVPLSSLGKVMGQLEPQLLIELDLALRGWLELPRRFRPSSHTAARPPARTRAGCCSPG